MNVNRICMKCMTGEINEKGKCTSCGAMNDAEKNGGIHLPVRTILKGKYVVGRVIGEGGFGITYIGYDLDLQIRVAIKEFCPKHSVGRETGDGLTLYPYDGRAAEDFEKEKDKFINEARRLAKFRNQGGVVAVLDYFIENGTAYIVMDYIDGITLKSHLKNLRDTTGRNMKMEEVLNLFKPVMETLVQIHESGIIHRDISPENIMISKDFKNVYLIDFGTARDVENGHTLSEYYKSFYSPIEQRSSQNGKMEQGPWTDVYALCATIYVCITGRVMSDSVSRLIEDDLILPSKFGVDISSSMEESLMNGLAVKPENRIRSMEELIKAFYDGQISVENETQKPKVNTNVVTKNPTTKTKPKNKSTNEPKADDSIHRTDSQDEKLEHEKQMCKREITRLKNYKNAILCFDVLLMVLLIGSGCVSGPFMIALYLVISVVIVPILCNKIVAKKKKNIFYANNLHAERILLQIETMKDFGMWDEKFFAASVLNQDIYKAGCLKYKDKLKHQYHQFVDQGIFKMIFYRHELLDYYYKTILTSNVSEELKEEWKQVAKDKLIIIE